MEKDFDPYHKWLGIPADQQPPHHYQLLGVPLYTSDLDVIENAADRQMAHVRRLAVGKYAELSQKILNELATARVCLLTPEQKTRYDDQLRRQIAAAMPAPKAIPIARALPLESVAPSGPKQLKTRGSVPQTTAANASTGSQTAEFSFDDARAGTSRPSTAIGRRKSGPSGILIGALLLVVFAGVFGVWFAFQKPADADRPNGTAVVRTQDIAAATPRGGDIAQSATKPSPELPAKRPGESDPLAQQFEEPPAEPNGSESSSTTTSIGEDETPGTGVNLPDGSLARSDSAATSLEKRIGADGEPLDATNGVTRKPLPSPSNLAAAQARVRQVFGIANDGDLADRSAAENKDDATKMLALFKDGTEPLEVRCALLIECLRLSLAAQQAESLNAAVDLLCSQFETDGWTLVADAAANLPVTHDEARKSHAVFLLQVVPACQAAESYRAGVRLAEAAQDALSGKSKRVLDPALRKQASEQIELLTSLADLHDGYGAALKTLDNSSADDTEQTAAHLAAGQYLAFILEDWQTGCEHLASSGDARLAAAAKADLEGQSPGKASDASAAKKRGDFWFDFGQRGKAFMRMPAQRRAAHWYAQALPDLKGRDKQNVEKRLAELDRELGPATQLLAELTPRDTWGRTEETGRVEFMYEGEKMLNSLWTNPTGERASYVTYDIDRKFIGLRGDVSIDDSARGMIQSDLIFTILGDGQVLWRSPPVGITQLKAPFDVNVKNIQTLTVQCECTGSEGYVHGVWIDPLLLRR